MINRDPMRRLHLSPLNRASSSVRGEDDDWGQVGLQSPVQIRKALNVEHVALIDKENSWDQVSDSVIDIFIHNFIDLGSQLLSDLSLLWSVHLVHQ